MKLLILTQKVHKEDDVLGFFHRWIIALSISVEKVTVICLEKGEVDLPSNVSVLSLGKEERETRWGYVRRFYAYIWRERKKYDAVFVHMNSEYLLLGGILWRLWGKRMGFWYNHTQGTWRARVAFRLAHVVFHTSPYAFSAYTKKSKRMPAGVDTSFFMRDPDIPRDHEALLYVGRIAPIKRPDLLVEALRLLRKEGIPVKLHIYGEALERDRGYFEKLREQAKFLEKAGDVIFHGKIPNTQTVAVYNKYPLFVNLTPRGNYDKTVLEAAACEALPVVSSEAFDDLVPQSLRFIEGDVQDLKEKLKCVLASPIEGRELLGKELREVVSKKEDLSILVDGIIRSLGKNHD